MLNRFLDFIKKHALILPGQKVLVAVSGGLDSMVLLNLCLKAGFEVGVAHCNFGLRGEESNGDELFVKQTCEKAGVIFFTKMFKTKEFASQQGVSTQMAARTLRYNWFNELLIQHGFGKLVVAHHAQDNLETVLLNFVRGTSISGLRGMLAVSGNIVRPLLSFERGELEVYAKKEGVEWREDSSNASDSYKRNFLRHNVIPLLLNQNPNLYSTFENTVQKNLEVEQVFQAHLESLTGIIKNEGEFISISKADILDKSVGPFQLSKLLKPYGFSFDQAKEVLSAFEGISGKTFITSSHQLVVDREEIFIEKIEEETHKPLLLTQNDDSFWLETSHYAIKTISGIIAIDRDERNAALDKDKLRFPLEIRNWEEGDMFVPLGMRGKKKVSDFMIDRKIPLNLKKRVKVMVSGKDIVWVVGMRIDDRFKVTEDTRQILSIVEHV